MSNDKTFQEKLDEILGNLGASNVPNTNGKIHEVDPNSISYVKQAILALILESEKACPACITNVSAEHTKVGEALKLCVKHTEELNDHLFRTILQRGTQE